MWVQDVTAPHTIRFGACTGAVELDVPAAGDYTVALVPNAHRDRGTVMAGGKEYASSDFLAGETITLRSGKQVLFVSHAGNHDLPNAQHTVKLPAGHVQVKPSKGFVGTYSIYLHRITANTPAAVSGPERSY
jgi:hypothetical protein